MAQVVRCTGSVQGDNNNNNDNLMEWWCSSLTTWTTQGSAGRTSSLTQVGSCCGLAEGVCEGVYML